MNQKYLAMFILTGFAVNTTPVFAEDAGQNEPSKVTSGPNFQQPDSSKPTNKNSAIQGTNAGGEKQMTVIDAGGNLKMVAPSQPYKSSPSGGSPVGNNFPPKTGTGPTGSQNIAPTNKPGQLTVTPNATPQTGQSLPKTPQGLQPGQTPMMPAGPPQQIQPGQPSMMPGAPQGTQQIQPGQAPALPGAPQGTQPLQPGQAPMMSGAPQGTQQIQPGQAPTLPGAPQGTQPLQPGQAPMMPGAPQGTQPLQPGPGPAMPGAPQGMQPVEPGQTPIAPGATPAPLPGQSIPPTNSGQTSQMMPRGPNQQMEISNSSATMADKAFVR